MILWRTYDNYGKTLVFCENFMSVRDVHVMLITSSEEDGAGYFLFLFGWTSSPSQCCDTNLALYIFLFIAFNVTLFSPCVVYHFHSPTDCFKTKPPFRDI